MSILTVATQPIEGQKPGTSGLRKKTRVFMGPHFVENFVQAILDAIGGADGQDLRARRRRALFLAAGRAGDPADVRGPGRDKGDRRPERAAVDPGREPPDPPEQDRRRLHHVGQPQPRRARRGFRPEVQHAERRPGARKRDRCDLRGDQDDLANTGSSRRRMSISAPSARPMLGDMAVEVVDPVARLRRPDGDAVRFPEAARAVRRRLPDAVRRDVRDHRPLRRPRSSNAASARPRAPWSTARRCPISAACTPTRTRPGRMT